MDDGARISIDKVGDNGDPLEPAESRRKFISQCGVLVRDMVPIMLEELHKPEDDNDGASYVDQRRKDGHTISELEENIIEKLSIGGETRSRFHWSTSEDKT